MDPLGARFAVGKALKLRGVTYTVTHSFSKGGFSVVVGVTDSKGSKFAAKCASARDSNASSVEVLAWIYLQQRPNANVFVLRDSGTSG